MLHDPYISPHGVGVKCPNDEIKAQRILRAPVITLIYNLRVSNIRVPNRTLIYNVCREAALT